MVRGCMISCTICGRGSDDVMMVRIASFLVLNSGLIPCCRIPCIITFVVVVMATLVMSIVMSMGTTMMTGGLIGHSRFKAIVDRAMGMTGFINTMGCPRSGLILSGPFQELLMGLLGNVFAISMIQILALSDQFLDSPHLLFRQGSFPII